jgi:hypothetical protein
MQGTYTMVFLHQESIPGLIVALKHSLGLFLTIFRYFADENRSKNGIFCLNLEPSNKFNISR